MSLHIDISDEAQSNLEKGRRKNILSSIIVSVLTFILMTMIFIVVKIVIADPVEPEIIAYPEPVSDSPDPESTEISTSSASSSSPQVAKVITSTAPAEISVPVVDMPVSAPSASFSPSVEIGSSMGGTGEGIGSGIPGVMSKRCSLEDRLSRIKQSGGSEKYEASVVKGLNWLKKTQKSDGGWCAGPNRASFAGMALLAYLAHCDTPLSADYGESCQDAITYLIKVGKKNKGFLSETPKDKYISYEHAINTYALAEAYTFCKQLGIPDEGLKETLEKAATIIVESQGKLGGWMYYYSTKENGNEAYYDLSVSGWNIQALKAVIHSKAMVDERALKEAERFVKKMYDLKAYKPDVAGSGCFFYKMGQARLSMVPVGVLSLQMMGLAHSKEAREGVKIISEKILPTGTDAYTYYYAAQVLINRGGEPWKKFGKSLGDFLVRTQEAGGTWSGGYSVIPGHITGEGKIHYATCLSVLTLEVYYRFLPATGEGTRNTSQASGE